MSHEARSNEYGGSSSTEMHLFSVRRGIVNKRVILIEYMSRTVVNPDFLP